MEETETIMKLKTLFTSLLIILLAYSITNVLTICMHENNVNHNGHYGIELQEKKEGK